MTPEQVVSVLVWVAVGLGGITLCLLSWFAMRIVGQLDAVTNLLSTQYKDFIAEIHRQDLRIARLEAVQHGIGRPARDPVSGD